MERPYDRELGDALLAWDGLGMHLEQVCVACVGKNCILGSRPTRFNATLRAIFRAPVRMLNELDTGGKKTYQWGLVGPLKLLD